MKNFWLNKKVIVTGAAGFIGSHAVDALVNKGAKVTAIISHKHDSKDKKDNLNQSKNRIEILQCNLLGFEGCLNITKGQKIILNFAAMDGGRAYKAKHSVEMFRNNTQIVLNLLEAGRINNIDRILLMSSVEVYSKAFPFKEDEGFVEGFISYENGYVWSKRFSEIVARMYSEQYGMKIAIARPSNTYGPRDCIDLERGRVIPIFILEALRENSITIWGNGLQKNSFIYVSDLVDALLDLTEKYAVCDPVNIASEKVMSIKDLARIISRLLGKKTKLEFINNVNSTTNDRVINTQKAKKVISLKERVGLEEGLVRTIEYMKASSK